MNKPELEGLLEELDAALVGTFPGPELMRMLLVGGACLLFEGVTGRPTEDVDVVIFDLMGSEPSTLIYHSPVADTIRRLIKAVGKRHGLKGERQMFLNDDCAPFLLEMGENELPPMRLFKAYHRLQLYVPSDLGYILACKLMAGRPEKDLSDIEHLCRLLDIHSRDQAQQVVNQYIPSPIQQALYELPKTLDRLFGPQ